MMKKARNKVKKYKIKKKQKAADESKSPPNSDNGPDNLAEVAKEEPIINAEPLEENDKLNEINLVVSDETDTMKLKNPNEVYMEIYKAVKQRAKEAKKKSH